jgi:hypothetical protein
VKNENLHVAYITDLEFFYYDIWTQEVSENGKNLRTHQNKKNVAILGHPTPHITVLQSGTRKMPAGRQNDSNPRTSLL